VGTGGYGVAVFDRGALPVCRFFFFFFFLVELEFLWNEW